MLHIVEAGMCYLKGYQDGVLGIWALRKERLDVALNSIYIVRFGYNLGRADFLFPFQGFGQVLKYTNFWV